MTTIRKVEFLKLKRLQNLTIEFPDKGVVALMGENGIGKSTVLHALSCVYKPHTHTQVPRGDEGSWWTDWFVPHTGNYWDGSSVRVFFSDNLNGTTYSKSDRWQPRRLERRERHNRFIGLLSCMPHIESESQRTRFEFAAQDLDISAAKRQQLVDTATSILNRRYVAVKQATKRSGLKKFLVATVSQGQPPVESSYTSHYMGAGEYKVLRLIQEVISAPNGALILIEELEVSIHDAALRRLMLWLIQQAEAKELQVIFSTHWPKIVDFSDQITVRTLHPTSNQVACINGFRPMALHRMTGNEEDMRVITVWVEDSLAKRIVEHICAELRISPNVTVSLFGAIDNAFSVGSVLELEGRNIHRNMVVLDGDRYITAPEKSAQIARALSGTGEALQAAQANALRWFVQFESALPTGERVKPERFLLDAAGRVAAAGQANPWVVQYLDFAVANVFKDPDKSVVYNLYLHFAQSIENIELFLIDAASKDPTWVAFTLQTRTRLCDSAVALGLDIREGV